MLCRQNHWNLKFASDTYFFFGFIHCWQKLILDNVISLNLQLHIKIVIFNRIQLSLDQKKCWHFTRFIKTQQPLLKILIIVENFIKIFNYHCVFINRLFVCAVIKMAITRHSRIDNFFQRIIKGNVAAL